MRRKTTQRKPPIAKSTPATGGLQTMDTHKTLAVPEKTPSETRLPVTITTPDGTTFEIDDTPANLGRATALASEPTLRKFWDTPEESEAWRTMFEEM